MRLEGKTAIITGAASGQGAATARLFAREGASVIAVDRQAPLVPFDQAEVGGRIRFHGMDVTDEAGWATLIKLATSQRAGVDILINNAAVSGAMPLREMTSEYLRRMIDINLIAPFLAIKAVAPQMIERKSGSIVNISSVNGLRGTANMSAYDASKWGLRGMTKSLALELAPHGIRVNSIHPGAINTPMLNRGNIGNADDLLKDKGFRIGMGRIGNPEEVAYASLFLASGEASYVSGAEIAVDGSWAAGVYLDGAPDLMKSDLR